MLLIAEPLFYSNQLPALKFVQLFFSIMSIDPDREPVRVNKILGKQASIGPIPANQILPLLAIIIISYLVCDGVLGLGMPVVLAVSFWLGVSWLFLAGNDQDDYINRFRKPRGRNWITGGTLYVSPLLSKRERQRLKNRKSSKF